jgi:tetratricopeptide (TPR) repeat protein
MAKETPLVTDPYAYCPCGSGKKVKWCCAPYLVPVERAFALLEEGQQESAHQLLQELLQRHGDRPAMWLYYARFLLQTEQTGPAEAAIDQALQRDPNLGMGYHVRGLLREAEGELRGALMLQHKAADRLPAEARDQLFEVYGAIIRLGLNLRQFLTTRYALERALQLRPALPELHQLHEKIFGSQSQLPQAVRRDYRLRRTRIAIDQRYITGRLSDARQAYEQLVQQMPDDAAAWFNLGLIRAWQGEAVAAIEALYRSLDAETDDRRAEETGLLLEVLLAGRGLEDFANYLEYSTTLPIRDAERLWPVLEQKRRQGQLAQVQVDEETGIIRGYFIEEVPSLIMGEQPPLYRIRARLFLIPTALHLLSADREQLAALAQQLYEQTQMALAPPVEEVHVADPRDLYHYFLPLVRREDMSRPEVRQRQKQYIADFFETVWLHRPLRSLEGNSPLDAMGSSRLRKRVFGAVQYIEDCYRAVFGLSDTSVSSTPDEELHYDFQQLRHKLGLEYTTAPVTESVVTAEANCSGHGTVSAPSPPRDIATMNVAELATLDRNSLSVEELEQAMRAALRLEARELALAFAHAGVERPFDPARPDRYPLFAAVITGALVQGNYAHALEWITRAEQYDRQHNQGKRSLDYALKRANVYVRMRDLDRAVQAYEQLIADHTQEGRLYTTAAEEMLRLKATDKARQFAQRGLQMALQSQNRDLEAHCRELLAAAEKSG